MDRVLLLALLIVALAGYSARDGLPRSGISLSSAHSRLVDVPPGWRSTRTEEADCPKIESASRRDLAELLDTRDYDALEAWLAAHHDGTRANPLCDTKLLWAFRRLEGRGDAQALVALDEWVAARPESVAPWAARATALERAGWQVRGTQLAARTPAAVFERMRRYHARALEDADRAISRDPSHPVAYIAKLSVFRASSRSADSRRTAAALFALEPISFEARAQLVSVLNPRFGGTLAEVEEAAADAQTYAHRDPRLRVLLGFPAAYRALEAHRAGRWQEAILHYSNALQYGDYGKDWSMGRGAAHRALGQLDLARADYERALAITPDDPAVQVQLGLIRFLGGSDDALADVTQVLERAPTYAYGFEVRGWMHDREELWEEAASDYARVIELGSDSARISAAFGHVLYHHLDRHAEAEPVLERAIELDADSAVARFYLGEALTALGRSDEARAKFQDFLARADRSDGQEAALIEPARRYLRYP